MKYYPILLNVKEKKCIVFGGGLVAERKVNSLLKCRAGVHVFCLERTGRLGKYYDKKALIVDTRFNGGGDLVGDLTMFLSGIQFITYAIEDRAVGYEPVFRWTKPSVAMINEANYSDGHCFACGYQDLKIGKMVGMPVPGTCSFAGWEMLQNGSIFWGSVPVSAKNMAGEWLENNETVPEYKVKNMPGIIDNGRDQQLEQAVEVLLETVT